MTTGLDTWVANVANLFHQARNFMQVGEGENPIVDGSTSDTTGIRTGNPESPNTSQALARSSGQLGSLNQGPPMDDFVTPRDLIGASAIQVEVTMLNRTQKRKNKLLTGEVLNNLELAAYYVRLLLSVGFPKKTFSPCQPF